MKLLLNTFLALLILLYPVGVYFGLQYLEPKYIALGLSCVVILRVLLSKKISASHQKFITFCSLIIVGIILFHSILSTSSLGLKLYPVFMSLLFLSVFSYSIIKPPTIIEQFARLQDPDLPQEAIGYTKKITIIWCAFFVFNAMVSGYTVFFVTTEVWTLYNGLISYLLMGLLFVGEILYRKWVLKI